MLPSLRYGTKRRRALGSPLPQRYACNRVFDLPARASQGRFCGPDLVASEAGDPTGTGMHRHRMRWVSQNGPRSSSVAACAAFLKAAVVETPYQ